MVKSKRLCLALLSSLLFACNGAQSPSSGSGSTAEAKQYTDVDHTVFTTTNKSGDLIAEVTLDSWSYLPDGVYKLREGNKPFKDLESGIVITYTFTNHSEDPMEFSGYYWLEVFQNGQELNDMYSGNKDVFRVGNSYKTIDDWHNTVMDGGSVTIAQDFCLNDNSPVTIIIRHNSYHGSNYDEKFKTSFDLK